jgi:transposase-like protein
MNHSPETKAAALASVLAGETVAATARAYGVDPGTIRRWRSQAGVDTAIVQQQKKVAIGEQLYGLLEDYVETLRVQVRVTRDEAWIKKQDADKLAIFHGVLSDKSVRLAAALRPTDAARRDDE